MRFDRNQSLQELENDDWGDAPHHSYLVTTCHRLRRVSLRKFGVEDMRIMIGQSIGLPYLVPMALEQLTNDAFAAGDFYPGDLLVATLQVEGKFWLQRSELGEALAAIVKKVLPELDERLGSEATKRHVFEACEAFQRRSSRR